MYLFKKRIEKSVLIYLHLKLLFLYTIKSLLLLILGKPKELLFPKEVDTLNDELSNNQVFKIFESHELYFFAFLLTKMNIKRFVDYFNISNYMHNHFFRGEFKA